VDAVDEAFAAFVADRRPALLGTALLLAGDRRSAEELTQRALTRAARTFPSDAGAALLPALVGAATSRWARAVRAEQVMEALPDPFAAPDAGDGGPELAPALRDLPPRTRAAVVLRWHEQLPDEEIGRLLDLPAGTVAREAAAGLDLLRPALAPSAYERAGDQAPAEQRLSAQLARLAAAPGAWRLDTPAAVADVRSRRTGTRRRLAAGVVAAVCVAGVAVPLARWAPDPPPAVPVAQSTTAPSTSSSAPAVPAVPVLAGPTRGSLAQDPAFLAGVLARWDDDDAPPPGERAVVFAGDTPHGRAALVVGTGSGEVRGMWFTGPAGAAPDQLQPYEPRQLDRERPLTLLLGGPGEGTLLVLTAPGDGVDVSPRALTSGASAVARIYSPVPVVDGVAVVPATTTAVGPAISVRVTRQGQEVYRSGVDWPGAPALDSRPPPGVTPLRTTAGTPDPVVLGAALASLAQPLAVEVADLRPELLWAGELPLSRGPGTVLVVAGRSREGALVITTWTGGGGGAVGCGTSTAAGNTDLSTLTVARVCDVALPGLGPTGDGRWLVVSAPPAAVDAELLGSSGEVLSPLPLTDGAAVVPFVDGMRSVRTLDDTGAVLAEIALGPPAAAPFGSFGSGPAR